MIINKSKQKLGFFNKSIIINLEFLRIMLKVEHEQSFIKILVPYLDLELNLL